jgi:hypothetical protein
MRIRGNLNVALTARAQILWKATTNLLAFSLPLVQQFDYDFRDIGGLINTAGGTAGVNGDILLTTTGLASGDSLSLILELAV